MTLGILIEVEDKFGTLKDLRKTSCWEEQREDEVDIKTPVQLIWKRMEVLRPTSRPYLFPMNKHGRA